ncbi:MAG: acyl dehydratase, partial [Thermodesulfobacteriota bacterium]|nr:acyl dehydratase [Thermodesulfobacteriota bacterium]
KQHKVTSEEMETIFKGYDDELKNMRGKAMRYWEDVNIGDTIQPVPKGPLSMTDMQAFYAGFGVPGWGITEAHGIRLSFMRKHPAWATKSETGSIEPMADVHSGDDVAASIGVPQAYDLGVQRFSWMGSMMTNWMGDDGFLKRLSAQARLFNLFGDTQWMSGKVIKKYQEGNEYAVDFEIWCDNQRGERTTTGTATVWLPSKKEGRLPLDD